MGRNRIAKPDIERLPISDGDFIDVKKRLNHGEHEDYMALIFPYQTPGEPVRMDTKQVRTSKVLAYLIGWSLTQDGTPIPYSVDMPEQARIDTLRNLDRETFTEIHKAIDAHENKGDAAASARKNDQSGEKEPSAISPSPVDVAGDTNGSEVSTEVSMTSS